jgi:Carboxypeptidase regulatory-like domain/TonB dependent receptor
MFLPCNLVPVTEFRITMSHLTREYISGKDVVRGGFQILALIALVAASPFAQLTRGYISGTVQDSSGAVVEGVQISVREQATGIRRETVTNEAGVYRFVGLEPGTYEVEFSKPGFEISRADQVELTTAQEVVLNQTLTVAGAPNFITVESGVPGVQLSKASPTIERRFGRELLESLPFTGFREVTNLALLAPTVSHQPGGVSANGQRVVANNLLVDGVDNKDTQWQFPVVSLTPELASEVHVQTNAYSAEFGRNLGAQISAVMRAGTNDFHGQLWDYYGASWMSAETLANKRAGFQSARFSDHQAGANLGGPLRKDRTFFFLHFQALPHREGINANGQRSIIIPTPAGFAALGTVPLGSGQTPESRARMLEALAFLPDVHREIKSYESVWSQMLNRFPIEFGTTRVGISQPSDDYDAVIRLDHKLTTRDSLSFRSALFFAYAPNGRYWGQAFSNADFGARFTSIEDLVNQMHTLSYTRIFSPRVVNEFRFSFSRNSQTVVSRPDAGVRTRVSNDFTLGPSVFSPFRDPNNIYEAQNVLTWTHGRHSVKLGADLLLVRDTLTSSKQNVWIFNSFADFLNNQANNVTILLDASSAALRSLRQSYFAQDDFKVSPNLTLNLGLRYQTATLPNLFGAKSAEVAAAGVPLPARPDRNDWAPRLGFAYSPAPQSGWRQTLFGNGRTVFRAGYGISYGLAYEQGAQTSYLPLLMNYPWNVQLALGSPETLTCTLLVRPFRWQVRRLIRSLRSTTMTPTPGIL